MITKIEVNDTNDTNHTIEGYDLDLVHSNGLLTINDRTAKRGNIIVACFYRPASVFILERSDDE